jgi:ATP/maltotriose-dependent transcriptional regulator MalT
VKPTIRRRRIIARPRLIAALEKSRARVRMLVASAGYGKTILTEQWAAEDGVRVAWVRARRSSADVAVLARELAAAAAEIVPGCDRRLCERLNATTDPAGEVTVLAEMLAEDLMDWPDDAWIAIDDYHHLCAATAPETFVETVVACAPVRILISTRQRPSWVSTRAILYGEVLEVGQTALAMREEEADEVLAGAREVMSPGLLALADGWPAVIGLAGLTSSPVGADVEMPEELYEFFAEEVYRSLEPDVRTGLGLLAVAPLLDRDLARAILGEAQSATVCREALSLGIIDERGGRLELHPLAGAFLKTRSRRELDLDLRRTVATLMAEYRGRREWDAAFDLVERRGDRGDLDVLFEDALDDVLNRGRLATVQDWVDRAESRGLAAPAVQRAKAELALRHGGHMSAQAFAEAALTALPDSDRDGAFRLLMLAARAAHAGSREEAALRYYERAEVAAPDPSSLRAAQLGELMCASALELESAFALLRQLEASQVTTSDPLELVRMADKRLGLGFRFGFIRNLAEARLVAELVPQVRDPFARCSFRCALSCALNLSSYYREAATHASAVLAEASDLRISPVLPYGHTMLASALAGQRNYASAHRELDLATEESRRCIDLFAEQMIYASRVRVLLQEGRAAEACAIEPPELGHSLPAMRGEVLASRGLVLASLGRCEEARSLGSEASTVTQGIEATVLASAVETVCRINERDSRVLDAVEGLVRLAFDTGAVDVLVTTYRANPDLLGLLLSSPECREQTVFLIARAEDEDLASTVAGYGGSTLDPRESLSKREREVYVLACQGLSNAMIAKRLFISQATVKAHMHHVFDKLGIRSRTALALNAARDRLHQAAPATAEIADDGAVNEASSS